MPESNDTTLKPYTGPPATAANFARAFPEIEARLTKGAATLNPETQEKLNEFKRRTRSNPPPPATVINLHPFELQISHSRWTRGVKIPACIAGQPYNYAHIRGWMYDNFYVDGKDGVRDFQLIRPIERAAEFVQTFNDKEMWGSGVIIYEGERHPDKAGEVETYDAQGRPLTLESIEYETDDDSKEKTRIVVPVPIKRKLAELIADAIRARNAHYLRYVQQADQDYNSKDARDKKRDYNIPRIMAEVLLAEGMISAPPNWNLASRLEKGESQEDCPACGNPHKEGAFKCSCGHILNALEAYRHGAVEYGHVSFETLTSEDWDEAEKIKKQRDKIRAKREKQSDKTTTT